MSRADDNRAFVIGLNGRDKNGGTQLTMAERKRLFMLKLTCPCLSCAVLNRENCRCSKKGNARMNVYKPRSCYLYENMDAPKEPQNDKVEEQSTKK